MPASRREILEQVARGELSPEDAEVLLRGEGAESDGEPNPPQPAISAVRVTGGFGAIVIEGDASVAQADIDGAHSASVDGNVLVVHADMESFDSHGNFRIDIGELRRRKLKLIPMGHARGRRRGPERSSSLRIRMNPDLALDARLDAGSLSISGIHGAIRARAAAGPITIEDFRNTLDASVNAGAIRASGILTHGESRVRSDAGAVRLELDPASSVRIIADSAIGRIVLPGQEEHGGRPFGDRRQVELGDGAAILRVETAMGSIHVSTRS